MSEEVKNPKVFVSYSWSSAEHQKFVIELSEKLTIDGVIVIIDKWDLKEGQDKYVFMEKMVNDQSVDKVLIISDKSYKEKADTKTGGVGTESQIISSEIYEKVEQTKFIPIVTEFNQDGEPFLPTFLKNRIYVNFSDNSAFYDEYDKLLRNIYNQPIFIKPALGIAPAHLFSEKQTIVITQQKFNLLKDAITKEKIISKAFCSDYFEDFIVGIENYRLPEKDSEKALDDQLLDNLKNLKFYRDQLFEVYKLLITSTNDFSYYEMLFDFFEKLLRLNFAPNNINSYSEWWFDNYRFFNTENFLFFISILIKYKKYDEVIFFTKEKYYISDGYYRGNYDFTSFNSYIRSLDVHRKSRLNSNRISITADLVKERHNSTIISFEEIMQSDFILALMSIFDNNSRSNYWFPRTLVFKGWHSNIAFPIFVKAETKRYFEVIGKLFQVNDRYELIAKYKKADEVYDLKNWRFDYSSIPFETFMNLEKLYKA